MSNPKTSKNTTSAISSPESPAGHTRLSWQEFRQKHRSGPDHVPVSRFRAQDSGKDMPTDATSGPLFNTSSPSASLQRSLGSKLRAKMAGSGSPLYALTWSEWDMPAGVPICRLRGSARRTYGNEHSGWPTTQATNNENNRQSKGFGPNLGNVAAMTGWATPTARDDKSESASEALQQNRMAQARGKPLSWEVLMAGWGTPRSVETGHSTGNPSRATDGLSRLEDQVHGVPSNTSRARTGKRGQLNPDFSRWLMGFLLVLAKSARSAKTGGNGRS